MDAIQIKRGDVCVSFLADGELGYNRAEKALYIGDGGRRNQKLCSVETAEKVEELELTKLSATQIDNQPILGDGATINDVVNAFNSLISAMQTSGIMKGGE
jgi:hypothetical protein